MFDQSSSPESPLLDIESGGYMDDKIVTLLYEIN